MLMKYQKTPHPARARCRSPAPHPLPQGEGGPGGGSGPAARSVPLSPCGRGCPRGARAGEGSFRTMTEATPSSSTDPGPRSLAELEARLRRDLELLTIPPAKDWLGARIHPQWGPVLDVAIVGAGMAGLS